MISNGEWSLLLLGTGTEQPLISFGIKPLWQLAKKAAAWTSPPRAGQAVWFYLSLWREGWGAGIDD